MVLDTHTLLWWLEGDSCISPQVERILAEAEKGPQRYFISAVSLWELRLKERAGKLAPRLPIRDWPELLRPLEWLQIEPTLPADWIRSADLEWDNRDPADRLIATLAIRHGVPVLTKDRRMHTPNSPVVAIW